MKVVLLVLLVVLLVTGVKQSQLLVLRLSLEFDKRWKGMDEEEMIMLLKRVEEQEDGKINDRKEKARRRNEYWKEWRQIEEKREEIHVIEMDLGGAYQTSLGPHIFSIAPD